MKFELPETTIRKIHGVLGRYPDVHEAILYGSRAKGTYRTGSDIDLTLRGGPHLTIEIVRKILDDIDDLLLPYTVDLSILGDIRERELIEHIRRVGVPFYRKGPAPMEPA